MKSTHRETEKPDPESRVEGSRRAALTLTPPLMLPSLLLLLLLPYSCFPCERGMWVASLRLGLQDDEWCQGVAGQIEFEVSNRSEEGGNEGILSGK